MASRLVWGWDPGSPGLPGRPIGYPTRKPPVLQSEGDARNKLFRRSFSIASPLRALVDSSPAQPTTDADDFLSASDSEIEITPTTFTLDEKEPDTAENSDCKLFCETDTDYSYHENDRDVELTTNDEETENSDYELFYETDNNIKGMFEITGRRLINIAYFSVTFKGRHI
ncbi:hypothetical protein FQA39_LY17219 [Lamprigera yunnana]|nr:hypothetical protein FQA39_LY17219 [Lamprigera yunnana]